MLHYSRGLVICVAWWISGTLLSAACGAPNLASTQDQDYWCSGIPDGLRTGGRTLPRSRVWFTCTSGRLVRLGIIGGGTLAAKMQVLQLNVLLQLKNSVADVNGAYFHTWKVPWPGMLHHNDNFFCRWKGVGCSNSGEVTSLVLKNEGEGTALLWAKAGHAQSIPPDIGTLTALTMLDLSGNGQYKENRFMGLTGSIPETLGQCGQLQELKVQHNSLSGNIPLSLSKLTALHTLDLSYNNFSGSVPQYFGAMTGLTTLGFSGNNLTGPLPQSLTALSKLEALQLNNLPVTDSLPSSIGSMAALTQLSVSKSPSIGGPIPVSLSNLSSLASLTLKFCNISGDLPSGVQWWEGLRSLSEFTIESTPVSGRLPPQLGPAIEQLTIRRTNVSGPIPVSLQQSLCSPAKVSQLAILDLSFNKLSGPFPSALSGCLALNYLVLENNRIRGGIPQNFFSSMGNSLLELQLGRNRLSGTLPVDILRTLTSIQTFNISNNRFSGPPPVLHCASPAINGLYIEGNSFQGNIKDVFGGPRNQCSNAPLEIHAANNLLWGALPPDWADSLSTIRIHNNKISGPVPPPSLTQCSSLRRVSMGSNLLSGPFPLALLTACPILDTISLSHNRLSGPFPEIPGALADSAEERVLQISQGNSSTRRPGESLLRLDLSGNLLSGSIPSSIGLLRALKAMDLSINSFSSTIPSAINHMLSLSALNLSVNNLSGLIPPFLGLLPSLASLSLSGNQLSGQIPGELAHPFVKRLTFLDLSKNKLSGAVPYGYTNNETQLQWLNLSSNNLSGPIPGGPQGLLSASWWEDLANNPFLCGGAGYPPCPEPPSTATPIQAGLLAGLLVAGLAALGLVVLAVVWLMLEMHMCMNGQDKWRHGVLLSFHQFRDRLTIHSLVSGTGNFCEEFCLGRGGFGTVYKSTLPCGMVVAVKRLNAGSSQGHHEFTSEVAVLGKAQHRNIVCLLAAYIGRLPEHERLLVYEFLPGGSLDKVLTPNMPPESPLRSFRVRHRIALQVARGLKYLHHECSPGIIHRDMKPANVLLDSELRAKVADFGLSAEMDADRTHRTTAVLGTAGFVAPEYSQRGRLSFKSDVYAFGVTLIQLLSGRRTSDEDIVEKGLQRWAQPRASILDPLLQFKDECEESLALAAIKVGRVCIARRPVDRPDMLEVLNFLENLDMLLVRGAEDVQDVPCV